MTYEYLVTKVPVGNNYELATDALNKLGAQGWDLWSIQERTVVKAEGDKAPTPAWACIFRRLLPSENENNLRAMIQRFEETMARAEKIGAFPEEMVKKMEATLAKAPPATPPSRPPVSERRR